MTEVRFGRLDRRGLLLGLSATQLGLLGTALIVLVAAGISAGPAGTLVASPIWGIFALFGVAQVRGRPLTETVPIAVPWLIRRLTGRHVELGRTCKPSPLLNIPGARGTLRITPVEGTTAAVLGHARPGAPPVTIVARVRGRGFLLESGAVQDRRVASWARVLGSLGQLPHVVGVQIMHRIDHADRSELLRWWSDQRDAPGWAQTLTRQLVEDRVVDSRVETLVAVSVRLRRGTDIATVLRAVGDALDGAEITVEEWLDGSGLRSVVRSAYDPAARRRAPSYGGPMGVAEAWSHARSDSALHATFWISEWPRSDTHAGFLRPLLLAPGTCRTFSLIAEPLPTTKALREIRRARAEQVADAATRSRIGQVEEETHRAAATELARREADLIAGHGDLRFVGLISVTATTIEELEDACLALQTSAGQAGCDLQRLVGQQVQAFAAAALPLARVLR
jgi:hypothetical protein